MFALHQYQRRALRRLWRTLLSRQAAADLVVRLLLVMATGLGKTVTAGFFARRWLAAERGRILVLCHDTNILDQNERTFREVLPATVSFGKFTGRTKDVRPADCLFASFGAMRNALADFPADEFGLVIVDESHRGQASTYRAVIDHFRPKTLLGMTATPKRGDGLEVEDVFGPPVVNLPLEKALARGHLCQVDYKVVFDGLQLEALRKFVDRAAKASGEKLTLRDLNHRVFLPGRDEAVAARIVEEVRRIPDCKALVFCQSVTHVKRMEELLRPHLPGVSSVYHSRKPQSRLSRKEQDRRLASFRAGTPLGSDGPVRVMLSVDKFNEGIDVPDANLIVFLRSTASLRIFLQQLGRGLRKLPDREKTVTVLDFVASWRRLRMIDRLRKGVREAEGEDKSVFEIDAGEFNFSDVAKDVVALVEEFQLQDWPEGRVLEALLPFKAQLTPVFASGFYRLKREHPGLPSWYAVEKHRAFLEANGLVFDQQLMTPEKALVLLNPHREKLAPLSCRRYKAFRGEHRELPGWGFLRKNRAFLEEQGFNFKKESWTGEEVLAAVRKHRERLTPLYRGQYSRLSGSNPELPAWRFVRRHAGFLKEHGFAVVKLRAKQTAKSLAELLLPHKQRLTPLYFGVYDAVRREVPSLPNWDVVLKHQAALEGRGFVFGRHTWTAEMTLEALRPYRAEISPLAMGAYTRFRKAHRHLPHWDVVRQFQVPLLLGGFRFKSPRWTDEQLLEVLAAHKDRICPLSAADYRRVRAELDYLPRWWLLRERRAVLEGKGFSFR